MKQAEKIYMISDAAKQVKVEAHVLRSSPYFTS